MRLHLYFKEDDEEIQGDIGFTESRRYVIRSMVPEGYETHFQEQARYISAHTSTAIEGNPLTDDQAKHVLIEGGIASEPNEIEKVNLQEAYELMAPFAADKSVTIDQGIIRTVNSIILKGLPNPVSRNRGKYRPGPSWVIDADTKQVRYTAPPAEWVHDLMNEFENDLQSWIKEYPGPIAAALAHFGLVSIHPFEDGNGRVARLIADMVLGQTGWSVDGMLSMSGVLLDRRSDYYEVLRETQGDGFLQEIDATRFVRFHTSALGGAAARLEERVIEFNKHRDELLRSTDGAFNPRQVTCLMFMLDVGPISTSQYARMTEISPSSALADLSQMANSGVVLRIGAGKSTRYTVNSELLKESPASPEYPASE